MLRRLPHGVLWLGLVLSTAAPLAALPGQDIAWRTTPTYSIACFGELVLHPVVIAGVELPVGGVP